MAPKGAALLARETAATQPETCDSTSCVGRYACPCRPRCAHLSELSAYTRN
jgi:hypothetical protein|eukprot:SAG25_NODE_25_length_21717_cov_29.421778_23_plen_51_part_00